MKISKKMVIVFALIVALIAIALVFVTDSSADELPLEMVGKVYIGDFAKNSYAWNDELNKVLLDGIGGINLDRKFSVRLSAYSDSSGSASFDYNQSLSKKRLLSVYEQLVKILGEGLEVIEAKSFVYGHGTTINKRFVIVEFWSPLRQFAKSEKEFVASSKLSPEIQSLLKQIVDDGDTRFVQLSKLGKEVVAIKHDLAGLKQGFARQEKAFGEFQEGIKQEMLELSGRKVNESKINSLVTYVLGIFLGLAFILLIFISVMHWQDKVKQKKPVRQKASKKEIWLKIELKNGGVYGVRCWRKREANGNEYYESPFKNQSGNYIRNAKLGRLKRDIKAIFQNKDFAGQVKEGIKAGLIKRDFTEKEK